MGEAMIVLRRLIALCVVAAGAGAIYFFCVMPYQCNRIKKTALLSTQRAYTIAGTRESVIAARQTADALLPCFRPACHDVSLDMLMAANARILGRNEEAVHLYEHALQLDRRPEIYVNLGAAELAIGRRAAARDHMLRAVLFNAYMIQNIEDGVLRQEILKRAIELRPENEDFIRYAHNLGSTQ